MYTKDSNDGYILQGVNDGDIINSLKSVMESAKSNNYISIHVKTKVDKSSLLYVDMLKLVDSSGINVLFL